jgi:hypothetical protein
MWWWIAMLAHENVDEDEYGCGGESDTKHQKAKQLK